jgi:hypothetical protein
VLFLIELDTRRVYLAGVTANPDSPGSPSRPATSCWPRASGDNAWASWCATATPNSRAPSTTCSVPRARRCW